MSNYSLLPQEIIEEILSYVNPYKIALLSYYHAILTKQFICVNGKLVRNVTIKTDSTIYSSYCHKIRKYTDKSIVDNYPMGRIKNKKRILFYRVNLTVFDEPKIFDISVIATYEKKEKDYRALGGYYRYKNVFKLLHVIGKCGDACMLYNITDVLPSFQKKDHISDEDISQCYKYIADFMRFLVKIIKLYKDESLHYARYHVYEKGKSYHDIVHLHVCRFIVNSNGIKQKEYQKVSI